MESGNGILRVGETVRAEVDVTRRESIMRNAHPAYIAEILSREIPYRSRKVRNSSGTKFAEMA